MNVNKIRQDNPDWTNFSIFTERGREIATTVPLNTNSIQSILFLFNDYDETIKMGLMYNGVHYHVHRFYNDLIYGRADPATNRKDGFCIARFRDASEPFVVVITYDLPNVSARMIPLLLQYIESVKDQLV